MLIEYLADHEALVPELGLLHFAEWGYLHPGETLEEHTERLEACCGRNEVPTVVVAISDGELLGSAMLLSSDLDTHPNLTPWLAGLYVVEESRGEGVGSALAERIAAEATSLGFPRLYLYTSTAESLYARLGFSVLERCDYHGERVVVMVRDLAAEPTD